MKNRLTACLLAILLLLPLSADAFAKDDAAVRIYPAPSGERLSQDYALEVNGRPVDIYLAEIATVADRPAWTLDPKDVGGAYSFAYFDVLGEVSIKVTSFNKPLDKLVIRPLSAGIQAKVEGNTATFTINKPGKFSIEPDGRLVPLLIFANPPEISQPDPQDPMIVYFGPGTHKPERIKLTSGQTLYIAGGAVVKGGVTVNGDNIRIMGRGILCGTDWEWRKGPGNMIRVTESTNVTVQDIIVRGAWSWAIPIYNSDSVSITNIKLVCSKNPNDDGINPCNSQRVTIRDCFIRTDDDCIAMKGTKLGSMNDDVENIVVENCLLWSDRARVFLLGHESRARYMRNIVLRNLEILHFNMSPFLFEPGEEMTIEDVLVENVTAYADYPRQSGKRIFDLIRLKPTINQYMKTKTPGRINKVTFRSIALTGEAKDGWYHVVAEGADADHPVTNVTFDNITWFGNLLNETSPQVRIGNFTKDIRFIRP